MGINNRIKKERATKAVLELLADSGIDIKIISSPLADSLTDSVYVSEQIEKAKKQLLSAEVFIRESLSSERKGSFVIDLTSRTRQRIRSVMGRDFESHVISANSIRHAKNNHGLHGKKNSKESIPLRDSDFELLPHIMLAPDCIEVGSQSVDKRDSIRYVKRISNGAIIVVEKELKNSPMDMETITMWANMSSSVADALRKKSPAIDVRNVITDTDIAKIRKDSENAIVLDKSYEKMSTNSHVYGFTNGASIFLTPDGINPYTPIHEYAHLWALAMSEMNPDGWSSIKKRLLDSSFNDLFVSGKLEGKSDDKIASEIISNFSADYGSKLFINAASSNDILGVLKNSLSDFWKSTGKDLFGIKNFSSLKEISQRVIYDMISQTNLGVSNPKMKRNLKIKM